MGTKLNPGKFDCYANAAPDEPYFVLLARDPMAPAIIRRWCAHRAMDPSTPPEQISEALECASAMEAWRAEHLALEKPEPPPKLNRWTDANSLVASFQRSRIESGAATADTGDADE